MNPELGTLYFKHHTETPPRRLTTPTLLLALNCDREGVGTRHYKMLSIDIKRRFRTRMARERDLTPHFPAELNAASEQGGCGDAGTYIYIYVYIYIYIDIYIYIYIYNSKARGHARRKRCC